MEQTKTIRRWFWVWDFEKEERWLNAMAMEGWALASVGWCTYRFERCEPGEYTVRLEMHRDDPSYVSFVEETGGEYVGRVFQWIYFRRKAELGSFELFSDIDSRVAHLKRIYAMVLLFGALNMGFGILNSVNGTRIGWLNLLVCALLMYGAGRVRGKIDCYEDERALRE